MEMKFYHGLCPAMSMFWSNSLYLFNFNATDFKFDFLFGSDVATDEVNHLFAAADADQDDRLSYDEILENHDLFVGSEATNYGDHLHNIHEEL